MLFRITILLSVFVSTVFAERIELQVLPTQTDPEITINLDPHYVAIDPDVASTNRLFVFFPGTFARPNDYNMIVNAAADKGHHAIGLTYHNDAPVNQLCGGGLADLDCYGDVRLEILFGNDTSQLVSVNRPNSAENRLIKLISYLDTNRPDENWGQFLDSSGGINWRKLVVAGHSQGGGHAGILGRYKPVARSIMFAAMDFSGVLQQPANWIGDPASTPNATPPEKFFAFSHSSDEAVNFVRLRNQIWPAYGIDALGPIVSVDGVNPPYASSHTLTSTRECENAHGCIVADIRTPIENGVSVYAPVWDYLLSGLEIDFALTQVEFERNGEVVPRPYLGRSTKGFVLRIVGAGFVEGTEVLINDRNARIIGLSDELLRVSLPGGRIGAEGNNTLQVRLPDGSLSDEISY